MSPELRTETQGRYARSVAEGVTSRVERKVRADFEKGSVEPVLSRLANLQLPFLEESPEGRERVQAAVVLLAQGRWPAFDQHAAAAETDWRSPERLNERLGTSQAS
jgi:hypothetical protein